MSSRVTQAEQVTVKVLRGARKALSSQEKPLIINKSLTLIRGAKGAVPASGGKLLLASDLRPVLSLAGPGD